MGIFTDVNPAYGTNSNDFIVQEAECIKNSLRSILTMTATSNFFRPEFESPLQKYIFRACTKDNAVVLFLELESLLRKREPRITIIIEKSSIVADVENRRFLVSLVYVNRRSQQIDSFQTEITGGL